MFNLLPEQEKKKLRVAYRRRRLTIFLTAFLVVVVVSLLLMIPLYVLSYAKKTAADAEARGVRETYGDTLSVPLAEINHTKGLLKLIGSGKAATSSSFLISTITDARSAGIQISSLSVRYGEAAALQVQGVAATRESLRAFATNLENLKLFSKVDVPVASFARDADIPFTIGLTLLKEKK